MHGFRNATTKEEFDQIKEIIYNKNLDLFDPEVFKNITRKLYGRKILKELYGYDFVSINKYPKQPVTDYQCLKHIYQAEFGSFANKCRRKGGFFKCCLQR